MPDISTNTIQPHFLRSTKSFALQGPAYDHCHVVYKHGPDPHFCDWAWGKTNKTLGPRASCAVVGINLAVVTNL